VDIFFRELESAGMRLVRCTLSMFRLDVCVCFYRQIYVTHKRFQYKYHTKLGTKIPKYLSIIFIFSRIGFPACKVKFYGLKEKKEKLPYL